MCEEATKSQNDDTKGIDKEKAARVVGGVAKTAFSMSILVVFGAAYTYGYNKVVHNND